MTRALEELKIPELERLGRAADTIQQYRRSIRRWEDFVRGMPVFEYRIIGPVLKSNIVQLRDVSARHLEGFEKFLRVAHSPREVSKTIKDVQAVLARAKEVGSGLLSVIDPPRLRLRSTVKIAPKMYFSFPTEPSSVAELNCDLAKIWQACEVATWPAWSRLGVELNPVWQWRAACVMFAQYGFRTEELIKLGKSGIGIDWVQFSGLPKSPAVDGRALNAWGWFHYVPSKQRWAKSQPLVLPLTEVARKHLDQIGGFDRTGFAFDWPICRRDFYEQWRQIVEAAELPKMADLAGQPLNWEIKHFRKTCVTWIDHYWPGLGACVTGHAKRSIDQDHYRNAELRVVAALNDLPIPSAWKFWTVDKRINDGSGKERPATPGRQRVPRAGRARA